jgi:cytochrome P450
MTPSHDADLARGFQLSALPLSFYDDPYPTYAALRAHDPVRLLDNGSVLLTRYDDVAALYRLPTASSDKKREFFPRFGDSPLYEHHTSSLIFNDPPSHTRVRKLMLGALNQRAITRMQPGVQTLVDDLLNAMAERAHGGETVDLITAFAAAIPIEVIGNLLAFPRGDRDPLRGWSLAILSALEPAPSSSVIDAGNRAVSDFIAYLKELVANRRAHPLDPNEDVLTRLIQGEADGERLSEKELLHNCIFLLNAGHETTTNVIGSGVQALVHFPDEQRRLRADPWLIGSAVEEMLRYDSPVQLGNRLLTEAAEFSGQRVPAGTYMTLCIGAANRDAAQFDDPDRFDVSRKPNRQLAFGHGDHACAGMNVARMEVRIAMASLLARFAHIEPAGDPVRDRRARFRGFSRLPVRLA